MSKSMIESFTRGQYLALGANDNKERLKYMVAGCKDGHLYAHDGADYGLFNEDAPDTEFIPESDLELSRITGSKIATITLKMQKFFDEYGSKGTGVVAEVAEVAEDEEDETEVEAPVKKSKVDEAPVEKSVKKSKVDEDEDEVDMEAVEKAVKKAIKKENFKKAQKLIDAIGGNKKLQKKLDKAQEN